MPFGHQRWEFLIATGFCVREAVVMHDRLTILYVRLLSGRYASGLYDNISYEDDMWSEQFAGGAFLAWCERTGTAPEIWI